MAPSPPAAATSSSASEDTEHRPEFSSDVRKSDQVQVVLTGSSSSSQPRVRFKEPPRSPRVPPDSASRGDLTSAQILPPTSLPTAQLDAIHSVVWEVR